LIKIINVLLFYKINKYLKKQKKKLQSKIVYSVMNNYYYTELNKKSFVYLLNSENYITLILNTKSNKNVLKNLILKKWFYLRLNN